MLYKEGKLSGIKKEYPIELYDGSQRKKIIIKNDDELIIVLSDFLLNLEDGKLGDALWNYCIGEKEEVNTMQLCDNRTATLIKEYEFYKYAPHKGFDNKIWFESVIILNKILVNNE